MIALAEKSARDDTPPNGGKPNHQKNAYLQDPDVQLMLQVRQGNPIQAGAAFEQLVERYQARLISLMEMLVGREQGEDLAQEVFLRVYRARKSYQPTAKFCTWFFAIANRVASNARRYLSRRRCVHLPSYESQAQTASGRLMPLSELALDTSGVIPDHRVELAEAAQVVRSAIATLGERQRTVMVLARFEHMAYDDIADAMGVSRDAVKSLAARARCNLQRVLEPYMREGTLEGLSP